MNVSVNKDLQYERYLNKSLNYTRVLRFMQREGIFKYFKTLVPNYSCFHRIKFVVYN